jgi:predicted dinucleotide-utilizing enzyme
MSALATTKLQKRKTQAAKKAETTVSVPPWAFATVDLLPSCSVFNLLVL